MKVDDPSWITVALTALNVVQTIALAYLASAKFVQRKNGGTP